MKEILFYSISLSLAAGKKSPILIRNIFIALPIDCLTVSVKNAV
jgi:hypothetical protein